MKLSRQFRTAQVREARPVDLKRYDGVRIVVLLAGGGRQIPFYGMAQFERHETLGNVLRIQADPAEFGSPEVILAEEQWEGSIEPLDSPKAEYRFVPSPSWPPLG